MTAAISARLRLAGPDSPELVHHLLVPPGKKLYFTDPRATPVSVSSLGSKLEQALASGLRMSRKYEHLVSRGRAGGRGGQAGSDRESTTAQS